MANLLAGSRQVSPLRRGRKQGPNRHPYCTDRKVLIEFSSGVQGKIMRAGIAVTAAALLGLMACNEEKPPPEIIRPVRTVTVEHRAVGERISLSGQVEAAETVNLSFRIGGKVTERLVSTDDVVSVDQIVARLDPQEVQSDLRSAQADLAAAQASLTQTEADEERQRKLLAKGIVSQARYDQARQALETARSQTESASARLQSAEDRVRYTELRADGPGTVVDTGAEVGEIVTAGQPIILVAREGGRDAVFNVPSQLIRTAPQDPNVKIVLADDPNVTAEGRVREVAPQADPATRTFEVKVGIEAPPPAMMLGAIVIGEISMQADPAIALPASALMQAEKDPAVWVVDPAQSTVSLRPVRIDRYETDSAIVSDGLTDGEIVVTAGVQALRPGQKVKLLGATP
jgi:RND family efflux transporter MFP subunit